MTPKEITTLAGHRLVPPWVMKLALDVAAAEREKQAEQSQLADASLEPVAYLCNGTRYKVQKLVGDVMICGLPDELIGEWVALVDATDGKHLRAAPVRIKDLTDDEIVDVMNKIYGSMWTEQDRDFARAVIQEYRSKNGII